MSESKGLHLFMAVVCTVAVVVAQDVDVRMPRKNVLSMTDFKNAGDTWYGMYIADSLLEDNLSFNAKLNLTVLANDDLEWSYRGQTQRPDSFPLMSAVNDVKRNTDGALTFDGSLTTSIGIPFRFVYTMIGEHNNFTAAQALETIALILFIVLPFLVGIFVCVSSARVRCVALCAIVVCFLAMFFTLVGMIVWMVYVTDPYVASWSMGLTVLAGILAGIAGLLIICDGLTDDYDDYDDRRRYDDRPPTYKTAPPTPRIIQGTRRLVPVRVL